MSPAEKYLSTLSDSSQTTIAGVLKSAAKLLDMSDDSILEIRWDLLDVHRLSNLFAKMESENYSTATMLLYYFSLRGVFRNACDLGLLSYPQLQELVEVRPALGVDCHNSVEIDDDKIIHIINACSSQPRGRDIRDTAIFSLIYGAGFGPKDVERSMIQDIDFNRKIIYLRKPRGLLVARHIPEWAMKNIARWTDYLKTTDVYPDLESLFVGMYKDNDLPRKKRLTSNGVEWIIRKRGREENFSIRSRDIVHSHAADVVRKHGIFPARKILGYARVTSIIRFVDQNTNPEFVLVSDTIVRNG